MTKLIIAIVLIGGSLQTQAVASFKGYVDFLEKVLVVKQTTDKQSLYQKSGNKRMVSYADATITTLAELDAITASNSKVIAALTADWCYDCQVIDKALFYQRPVSMQEWHLVKIDVTDTNSDSEAILAHYDLFGPPTLLYYQQGELVDKRVGSIDRQEFEQTLATLNKQIK